MLKSFEKWLNESSVTTKLTNDEKKLLVAVHDYIIPKLLPADIAFKKWTKIHFPTAKDEGIHLNYSNIEWFKNIAVRSDTLFSLAFKGMKEGLQELRDDELLGIPDSDLGEAKDLLSYDIYTGTSNATTFSRAMFFKDIKDGRGYSHSSDKATEFKIGDISIFLGFTQYLSEVQYIVYIFKKDVERLKDLYNSIQIKTYRTSKKYGL